MNRSIQKRSYFISYNNAQADYARALAKLLKENGFEIFFDQDDVNPGDPVGPWMDDALTDSTQMICLFSENYFSDKAAYSAAERYAAWHNDPDGKQRRLIPVMVEDCQPTPLFLNPHQIDVRGMDPDEAAEAVLARLQTAEEKQQREHLVGLAANPEVYNVPRHRLQYFVGRTQALDDLHRHLDAGSNVAVTAVHGMGGIGKTTLACEYAHRFANRGRYAGVWWIPAESSSGIVNAFARLAARLGIPEPPNQVEMAQAVVEHLGSAQQPWLLIFDNLPNRAALRYRRPDGERDNWIPGGKCQVLITSRSPNFGADAALVSLDTWDDEVAAEYLLERTPLNDGAGALALAKELGGLPLAVEQAGAYLATRPTATFEGYAADLADKLALAPDPEEEGDYNKTVYAALTLGLENLSQAAQDLMCLLSWLSPDGCQLWLLVGTAENFPQFTPDPLGEALRNEQARSDLIREVATAALLRTTDEGQDLALITHRITQTVLRRWQGIEGRAGWNAHATELVSAVFPYDADQPSTWELCETLLPHAMVLAEYGPRAGESGMALGYVLNQAGIFRHVQGDTEGAIAFMEPNVDLARETYDPRSEPFCTRLSNLSAQYTIAGWYEQAEAGFLQVLEIEEEDLGSTHPKVAIRLNNLAEVYWKQNDFARAEPLLQRALEIGQSAENDGTYSVAAGLNALGSLYDLWAEETGNKDHRDQAQGFNKQAISTARAARGERHPEVSQYLHNFAVFFDRKDDFRKAADLELRAATIMVSLNLMKEPYTQQRLSHLLHFWDQAGQGDRKDNMGNYVIPDVLAVEMEMMEWVKQDPENRHFGPKSFFAGKPDELAFAKNALGIEGDIDLPGVES